MNTNVENPFAIDGKIVLSGAGRKKKYMKELDFWMKLKKQIIKVKRR
jgi:hypothetical protein